MVYFLRTRSENSYSQVWPWVFKSTDSQLFQERCLCVFRMDNQDKVKKTNKGKTLTSPLHQNNKKIVLKRKDKFINICGTQQGKDAFFFFSTSLTKHQLDPNEEEKVKSLICLILWICKWTKHPQLQTNMRDIWSYKERKNYDQISKELRLGKGERGWRSQRGLKNTLLWGTWVA